ncbi:SWIM zinc finger family protein [Streptomyces sp. DSM 41921]|uniref:SWIM zinc finger family protein n=2 Tax=Streptomyces dubilierae TaxID=3075533 RepID=A0ABU2P6G2_9ACTN|nr:SWIM zinc finger family protein [Streptomyces sp. DSM 41921]MDT0387731.1 SWIM zinc finger family protein [Streptomyces sp. DSM 41921]
MAGPRAADVAREALRAARDDARRAREETEREGARRRRRARQKLVDDRAAAARRARDHGAGGAAPDVRRLLSDAFRMPDLPDLPDEPEPSPSDRGERASGRGGAPSRLTGLLHGGAPSQPGAGEAEDATESPATPRGSAASAASAAGTRGRMPQDPAADSERPPTPGTEPGVSDQGVSPTRGTVPGVSDQGVSPTRGTVPGVSDQGVSPTRGTVPGVSDQGVSPTRGTVLGVPDSGVSPTPLPDVGPAPSSPTPRSMAAPNRDGDLRRTFPAFPPREGDRFAESWWGNAWVSALEQGALDVKRLERGRGYAEQGHVDAITVTPGLVLAYVQGSRPRPYRVQVRLRTLGDSDWDRFLEAAADRPGHIAALLDKEMPRSLAQSGVPLLPGPGDLEPRCSCPDRGHPCKHAAALCYQTARLLDADPFVLLLLRGRGERELLDALSRLSATRAARAAQDREPAPLPGVRAKEALQPRTLPPLPAPLPPPAHPEQPPAYPASPGGPDPFALDQLATDAAARAHALLTSGRDPVGRLTFWQDAVRLAAARPGSGLTAGSRALYSSLAAAAGRTPADLARAVAAWRQGGLEGLAVLEEPWDPPAGRFDRARPLLLAADLPAFRPWRNHLTHPHGHLQLRLGRDGLWYAYESEPGRDDWWPRGTPDLDPVGALTGLGLSSEL